jgi:hypothetical protein
MIKNTRG